MEAFNRHRISEKEAMEFLRDKEESPPPTEEEMAKKQLEEAFQSLAED